MTSWRHILFAACIVSLVTSLNHPGIAEGRADQTTEDYYITAPICVMGEWNINQPALMERMLIVRFDGSVKKEEDMQEAFSNVKDQNLEGFMPHYIKFCLNQDADQLMRDAKSLVEGVFGETRIAPRIKHNLSVMLLGLKLFRDYAIQNKIEIPELDYSIVLRNQLKEITGSETGFVRSALDQFIDELSVMATISGDTLSAYWTRANVGKRDVIAIRFNEIYPLFREHIKRRSYEGTSIVSTPSGSTITCLTPTPAS